MNAFGLTGNIGCGKSTVLALLGAYPDVVIFNCDNIAKVLLTSILYRDQITSILGSDIVKEGNVDLQTVAKIVFTDEQKKKEFEAFIHPLVWLYVEQEVTASLGKVCIVESAIIFETKSEDRFRSVITVSCSYEEQIRRLKENRNMSDQQIRERLTLQLPLEEKEKRSAFVIRTDCTMDELKARTDELYRQLGLIF